MYLSLMYLLEIPFSAKCNLCYRAKISDALCMGIGSCS